MTNQLAEQSRKMSEYHGPNRGPIHVFASSDLSFPLRNSPVTFAVRIKDGSVSSLWKVIAKPSGDVYIVPRDIMEGAKISLHASGQQHIVFRQPGGGKMVWSEPPLTSPVQASVKLLFTVWSAGTGPTRNNSTAEEQKKWEQNKVTIEAEDCEDTMISVCFFLTPPGDSFQLPLPPPIMAPVAVLPVGTRKELHVIACREHRPDLRAGLEAELNADVTTKGGAVSARGPDSSQSLRLLAGTDVDGRPYVAPVSVERNERGVELLRCRRALLNVT